MILLYSACKKHENKYSIFVYFSQFHFVEACFDSVFFFCWLV